MANDWGLINENNSHCLPKSALRGENLAHITYLKNSVNTPPSR